MPVLNRRLQKDTVAWWAGTAHYALTRDSTEAVAIAEQHGEIVWSAFDDFAAARLWLAHEPRLLKMWLEDHAGHGRRPWVWWQHSSQATEPRAIVSGVWEPATSRWRWRECGRPWGRPAPGSIVKFESQAHFLKRHGLFVRGEERRVSPDALEPRDWREEPLA